MWMTLKWLERNRIWPQCGRNWWTTWIDEPTSFLYHVYLGCTQRECKPNETIIEQHTTMFASRISAGATENYRDGRNLTRTQWRGPTTRKDMLKNAVNDAVNWQIRRLSNSTKFLILVWTTISSKKDELEPVGELPEVCSKNFLTMFALGTNWTTWHLVFSEQACKISHKMDSGNIVTWETRHSIAEWVCLKTQTLLEILRIQSQPQEVSCASLEAEHLFQSVVDVQETNVTAYGWVICSWSLGHGDWSTTYNQGQHSTWSHKLRETWTDPTQPY